MSTEQKQSSIEGVSPVEKKTPTRVYRVENKLGSKPRLVRATSQSRALHFASDSDFTVRVATQEDLETLLGDGVKVEKA